MSLIQGVIFTPSR